MRTFLGWVLVAALLGGLYSAIMFVPVYVDHWDVEDIANKSFNQFREIGVEGLRTYVRDQLNRVTFMTHEEDDGMGGTKVVNGMGMTDEDIIVEFDERTKVLHLRFEYKRVVVLKPTQRQRVFRFVYDKKEKPALVD